MREKRKENSARMPKWLALVLGFGALFAGDARADRSAIQPVGSASRPDEVLIRTEGEKIYFSQDGRAFEELALGNTAEAVALRELLGKSDSGDGSTAVPIGSFIVANGGPSVHGAKPKKPTKKKDEPKQAPASNPGSTK